MRLTTAILLISLMQVFAVGYAQKITINKTNAPLNQIINEIRNQIGYDFFYSNVLLKKSNPVTINLKNATLEDVLSICFSNQPITYKVDDKAVMLKEKERNFLNNTLPNTLADVDVQLTVLDENGKPLISATVTIKNTGKKLVTGAGGSLIISKIDEKAILEVSYLGFKTQEVKIKKNQSAITVRMELADNKMDELVITGIFNKSKESFTGAAKTITETQLKQFQGRNLFTTISNIDPSFYMVTNNIAGSNPNTIPEIQMRGARSLPNVDNLQDQTGARLNQPLIILDGFETTMQRMMDLDNNEILSITLLKDGSATALYGSRGANGVVVIKTKEPIAGKLRLTYRVGANISVPDLSSYHLLNSAEKLELERISGYYQSATKTPEANIGLQQYYNQILGQVAKGVNTDWLSIPLRTQLDQTHNLKMEGGDQAFRYDLGIQYNDINGVMKESGRQSFNGTVNLSYRYKDLTFRNNLVIGQTKSSESPYGSFSDYVKLNPYWEPYDATGKPVRFFTPYNWDYITMNGTYTKPYANPLYDATLNTYDRNSYTSITNNFQLEYRAMDGLNLRAGLGVTTRTSDADNFKPADHSSFNGYSDADIFRKGSYTYGTGKDFSFTGNLAATYFKVFNGIHQINAGINLDASESTSKSYSFNAEGFPDDSIDFLAMALQYQPNGKPGGGESKARRIGALANLTYALKDRYIAEMTYRVDGASQFGVNRRFAPFWSAGVAWNANYEDFIKDNLKFIDRLKFKGSYGSTGSTQFDSYQALGTYSYIKGDRYKTWLGAWQNELGNPDLEWQITNKYNVGLESEMFNHRLSFEANVYLEKTSNLLSSLELPYSNGFSSYNENIGKLDNRGIELSASYWIIKSSERRFAWSVTANAVYREDKITKLSAAMKAANEKLALTYNTNTPNKIIREGASQNTLYVVRSLGIDPSTGKELYLTKDGQVTYQWNPQDRVAAGLTQPKFRGNFSTLFRYSNFTLNASFSFRFGGQIYNQTLIDKIENADRIMNVDSRVFYDRWKNPGDISLYRGINEVSRVNPSSRFVQNESTITLQNVNLSYEMRNQKFLHRLGLQSLSFTGNTGELFYLSSVPQERGLGYPFTRQFSLSVYASF